MNIFELQESVDYQLSLGVNPSVIEREIRDLAQREKSLEESTVRYKKVDRNRSRIMSRPSTRNKIKRAMQRPSNRRRMQAGYRRWLKSKGSRYLSRTAKKRFEIKNESVHFYKKDLQELQKSFEFEDIKLVIAENLINSQAIFEKFKSVELGKHLSKLEKAEFLYKNFKEEFISVFIDQLLENGIIMDQEIVEESTTTADVSIGDGIPHDNSSPWKNKKDKESYLIDYLPFTVNEVRFLLEDLLEANSEDDETSNEIQEVIQELSSSLKDFDKSVVREEVKNFIGYVLEVIQEIEFQEKENTSDLIEGLISLAGEISYKRKYEDSILNIVKSGIKITESQYLELKRNITGVVENE